MSDVYVAEWLSLRLTSLNWEVQDDETSDFRVPGYPRYSLEYTLKWAVAVARVSVMAAGCKESEQLT